jgi:phenylalanyl-tRNA synthetase alpha chain
LVEKRIAQLRQEVEEQLGSAQTASDLETLRVRFLGRKGPIQDLMSSLRDASSEERPRLGKLINDLKVHVEGRLSILEADLSGREQLERLRTEQMDITLPGRRPRVGRLHPVTQMMERLLDVHRQLGFSVQDGPEVDSDYHNFGALNFAPDHPARDMQDTFYVGPDLLLRTHTSNTQVRVMERHGAPLRIAAPGRCFRNEDVTARSHVQFHQVEGLYIDRDVSFADLQATLKELLSRLFDQALELRFRPSYFPFVEPGVEVDVSCTVCKGEGCPLCKGTGWLEILGAGLVHPNVLTSGGLDPEIYSGFAWGIGVERLVMLETGISDIRLLFENDLRLLSQC